MKRFCDQLCSHGERVKEGCTKKETPELGLEGWLGVCQADKERQHSGKKARHAQRLQSGNCSTQTELQVGLHT